MFKDFLLWCDGHLTFAPILEGFKCILNYYVAILRWIWARWIRKNCFIKNSQEILLDFEEESFILSPNTEVWVEKNKVQPSFFKPQVTLEKFKARQELPNFTIIISKPPSRFCTCNNQLGHWSHEIVNPFYLWYDWPPLQFFNFCSKYLQDLKHVVH